MHTLHTRQIVSNEETDKVERVRIKISCRLVNFQLYWLAAIADPAPTYFGIILYEGHWTKYLAI